MGHQKGWKVSNKTKEGHRGRRKRNAVAMNLDLNTYRPRSIGGTQESLANWLTDSIPAWDQLRVMLHVNRQKKKAKQKRWFDYDVVSYYLFYRYTGTRQREHNHHNCCAAGEKIYSQALPETNFTFKNLFFLTISETIFKKIPAYGREFYCRFL